MKPMTKFAHQIASAGDNIPSLIREAFRLAEEEKPGAVHIWSCPRTSPPKQTDKARPIPPTATTRRPVAEEKADTRAAGQAARRGQRAPVLVIGAGGQPQR